MGGMGWRLLAGAHYVVARVCSDVLWARPGARRASGTAHSRRDRVSGGEACVRLARCSTGTVSAAVSLRFVGGMVPPGDQAAPVRCRAAGAGWRGASGWGNSVPEGAGGAGGAGRPAAQTTEPRSHLQSVCSRLRRRS
ncbi:hypothetical protein T484DRAFT_1959907 [Baffinella frigidus]|nr:hypothetical protein T484DRAFT_1959907 [Cryptophyta sp. CCMP2293]